MRALLPFAAAPIAVLLGCTGTVSSSADVADAETPSTTAAAIVVERTTGAGDSSRGEAMARFMRVRARAGSLIDGEDALRSVGAAIDLPALGSCVSVSRRPATTDATIELLDVGSVAVEANGVRTPLVARQLPDVVDVVSGVVYAGASEGTGLPAGAPYVLRVAEGRSDSAPVSFVVNATAPRELDLRIGGQDVRTGSIALTASAPVELAWNGSNAGGNDDLVYVDVSTDATIRCAFADTGRATLDASAFAAGDEGTMSVHRLHRERFHEKGVDAGEVRFDFARVVSFTRR